MGLSAFFLLPAATLQDHISTVLLWGPGYRATDWSIYNTNFTMFTGLALALIILAWPARSFSTVLMVMALAAVRLLSIVWDIPLLNKAQFPWSAGRVTIHQADFPIWRMTRDGSPVLHIGPLISFDAQPGIYRIERVAIWQEKAGLAISIMAVCCCWR